MRCGGHGRVLTAGATVALLFLGGCVPQARYSETVSTYRQASDELGKASELLFVHANAVEAESFIDTQSFEQQPLSQTSINAHAVLSEEGIRFRREAIAALSAYTLALATVASGKTADQSAADGVKAGTGLAELTSDLQAALAHDNAAAETTYYSGVVAEAGTGAGELIQGLERHRNRAELAASLRKNDPAMKALFALVAADAERLYARQRLGLQNRGDTLFGSYARAIAVVPPDGAYVLELSDGIKRYRRDMDLLARSDPAPAFAAWSRAHEDLVRVLLGDGGRGTQKEELTRMDADVAALGAAVGPLDGNLDMLARAF